MKKLLLIGILCSILTGCITVEPPQTVNRDYIIRYLEYGRLGVTLGLNFAIIRGADPSKIAEIQQSATIAFDLVENAIQIDLSKTDKISLQIAFNQIKTVINDTLLLCKQFGVSASNIELIQQNIDKCYSVIQALINSLPDKEPTNVITLKEFNTSN